MVNDWQDVTSCNIQLFLLLLLLMLLLLFMFFFAGRVISCGSDRVRVTRPDPCDLEAS